MPGSPLAAGGAAAKLLLDPTFVLREESLKQNHDKMWGYAIWKKKNA
jgi:hypothetical protein